MQQAVLALATRDFGKAQRALSAAYRLQPSAETLYLLGVTALSSGDAVGAQDLMRRYLAEVGSGGDATRHTEAQRIAERPRAVSGEVRVLGPAAAFVLVDDKLVGRLPLVRPLLVATGTHALTIEQPGGTVTGNIEVLAGQGLEAQLPAAGTTLQVRRLPTVFVATKTALEPRPQTVTTEALVAAGLSIYDAAAHSGAAPPSECVQDAACVLRWAAAQGVQYTLELTTTAAPCSVSARVFDVVIAAEASQRTAACDGEGGVERALTELLPPLLGEGIARPRGTLQLTSTPAGAEVVVGGRSLGRTPLTLPRFAGTMDLALQLPGFLVATRRVEVTAQSTTEVQVALTAQPAATPALPLQHPRPRWRIALGITALTVGAGLLAAGIPALAIDGTCVQDPMAPILACDRRYATTAAGLGLVVPGALLVGAGMTALAIPGARPRSETPAAGSLRAGTSLLWGQF
ncbi:MAG: PEGA domain-containing protein [Pseudoxanthomonas sp.]